MRANKVPVIRTAVLFGLAAASLALARDVSALADKPATDMDRAMAQLQGTAAEQGKAIDFTLGHITAAQSALMFIAAARSLDLGRLQDAGFLCYAAELRAHFDLQRFPPVGKGGDSPGVALGAVRQSVGAAVKPAVMREPKTFKAVVDKLRAFDLATPAGYDPGWSYTGAKTAAEARTLAQAVKQEHLQHLQDLVTLLSEPEYFEAWKAIQDINLAPFDGKPHPERAAAREQAEKRALEIEGKMGIQGPFTLSRARKKP